MPTRSLGIALNGTVSGARPCTGTGERGEADEARGKLCCSARMRLKLGERFKEPPMLESGCVPGSAAVELAAAEDRRGGGGCASSSVSLTVMTKRCSSSSAFSTFA